MRDRTALASAAIVAAALALPHFMPRYVTSNAYVFRVHPLSGAVCVAAIETITPYELGHYDDLREVMCPAAREAVVAALREELARREQERGRASDETTPSADRD